MPTKIFITFSKIWVQFRVGAILCLPEESDGSDKLMTIYRNTEYYISIRPILKIETIHIENILIRLLLKIQMDRNIKIKC